MCISDRVEQEDAPPSRSHPAHGVAGGATRCKEQLRRYTKQLLCGGQHTLRANGQQEEARSYRAASSGDTMMEIRTYRHTPRRFRRRRGLRGGDSATRAPSPSRCSKTKMQGKTPGTPCLRQSTVCCGCKLSSSRNVHHARRERPCAASGPTPSAGI